MPIPRDGGRLRLLVRVWVVAAALALTGGACRGAGQSPRTAGAAGTGPRAGSATGSATAHGLLPSSPTALPQLSVAQFHQLLEGLRGRPVLVNIWASWCGPCIKEAPSLAQAARLYGDRVQFVGVDIQDQVGPARAFIQRFAWPYPSVFDPSGAIRDDMGFLGQPVTVIFDAAGKRVFTFAGPVPAGQIQAELAKLVTT